MLIRPLAARRNAAPMWCESKSLPILVRFNVSITPLIFRDHPEDFYPSTSENLDGHIDKITQELQTKHMDNLKDRNEKVDERVHAEVRKRLDAKYDDGFIAAKRKIAGETSKEGW